MNQPMGSCHSHFREVINLAEELRLRKHRNQRHPSEGQPDLHREEDNLSATPVLEPSESDGMEIDNQLEAEGGEIDNQLEFEGGSHRPFIEVFEGASKTYGKGTTFMAHFDYDKFANERTVNLYYPFASKEEWEIASFLLCSSLSMHAIDKFLSLDRVRLESHWKIRT